MVAGEQFDTPTKAFGSYKILHFDIWAMEQRLELTAKSHIRDTAGDQLAERIKKELNVKVACRSVDVYNLSEKLSEAEMRIIAEDVLGDSVLHDYSFTEPALKNCWRIEVGLLPGVTDTVGRTASDAIRERLGHNLEVYHSTLYAFSGEVDELLCERISTLLYNPRVGKHIIHAPGSDPAPYLPKVNIIHEPSVQKISLHMGKERFEALARERLLSLSHEEFMAIKSHFKDDPVLAGRSKVGLDNKITDVELEVISQTWGENCKHKIFNAQINYEENGERHAINSIFRTFIRGATEQVKKPYVVSALKDNGGIIKFNHEYDVAVKVEAHNSSAALDPYGDALLGVLCAQRDVLGTGLGATPIAGLDVLCFGLLGAKADEVPKGMLHPLGVYEGVVQGIAHGGNKTGVPTVNGSILFDRDYLCCPLVYCGSVGIMPSMINGRRTCDKVVEPGFLAVMVGGRIGRDGLRGAPSSSIQLDSTIPQGVVQIGDPTIHKKMTDFIIEARGKLLYEAITDNGAGGLSASIGELAQIGGASSGCEIYLDRCPLKYPGLDPWEILLSESQDRMSLAARPEKLEDLLALARLHDIEASVVGKFTNSGKFHVLYKSQTIAYLDMEFLHDGAPQLKLKASWKTLMYPDPTIGSFDPKDALRKLLFSPNITSRESVIRRYDHEVKGGSVLKPIMGGPTDAAVIRPVYNSDEGLVLAHGICPRYVQDGYAMASLAFDEAVRNAISVGAKFGYLACLDNFSWPDPIKSIKTPDGEQKLGSLVRACLALYDCATGYNVPIISGKNSLKNDYYTGDKKYSAPPTLLITVIGKIDNIRRTVSSEFKKPGDFIYVLGTTRDELGGSEFYRLFGGIGNTLPQVHPEEHTAMYKAFSDAIEHGLVASAHDVSDGGIAVALAESALGFGLGVELDLGQASAETSREDALLFAESPGRFVVSIIPENVEKFEKTMHGTIFRKAGRVRGDRRFLVRHGDHILINDSVDDLRQCYFAGIEHAPR